MSFWSKSPGPHLSHYIKSIFSGPKEPELLETDNIVDEVSSSKWTIRIATNEDIINIVQFWRDHFRRPNSPICKYDPDELKDQISSQDYILLIAIDNSTNKIIGTIMSQQLGNIKRLGVSSKWSSFNVRWIDMFCVHPTNWHKGVGSALLNQITLEHKRIGDAACLFMKEGSTLKIPAIRSSNYVYKIISTPIKNPKVESWSMQNFINYAQTIQGKTACIIHSNCGSKTKIFCYNGFRGRIIAAFVAGHEYDYDGIKPIIWNSGFLKYGDLLDSEISESAIALSDAAAIEFDSPYIWMDARHLGRKAIETGEWICDGSYHMYAYHMDTGIYFNAEPFLIL